MNDVYKALKKASTPLTHADLEERTGLSEKEVKSQIQVLWDRGRIRLRGQISREPSPVYIHIA